jgi:hypothetical protein
MNKTTGIALALAFLIIFSAALVSTSFGYEIRFYFGLLPFEESKSASVEASDLDGRYIIRPISDRYQLKFMNFITSATTSATIGEEEVILEGKHPDVCSLMNRTEPRYSMGWVNTTKIRIFETEYDAWYLQMWVRSEALYLNVRYQGEEYVVEKLFLIDDPDLAAEAHELMVEAWTEIK